MDIRHGCQGVWAENDCSIVIREWKLLDVHNCAWEGLLLFAWISIVDDKFSAESELILSSDEFQPRLMSPNTGKFHAWLRILFDEWCWRKRGEHTQFDFGSISLMNLARKYWWIKFKFSAFLEFLVLWCFQWYFFMMHLTFLTSTAINRLKVCREFETSNLLGYRNVIKLQ